MERKFEILLTQIYSLLEMYKMDLHKENEKQEPQTDLCEHILDRLSTMKYSTKYYHENKKRIPCKFCNKQINSLAKTSHYKSRRCLNNREEPRILTSRIE